MLYTNGSEYYGEWLNGKRNGLGKLFLPNYHFTVNEKIISKLELLKLNINGVFIKDM